QERQKPAYAAFGLSGSRSVSGQPAAALEEWSPRERAPSNQLSSCRSELQQTRQNNFATAVRNTVAAQPQASSHLVHLGQRPERTVGPCAHRNEDLRRFHCAALYGEDGSAFLVRAPIVGLAGREKQHDVRKPWALTLAADVSVLRQHEGIGAGFRGFEIAAGEFGLGFLDHLLLRGAGQSPLGALQDLWEHGAHGRRVVAIRGAAVGIPEFGLVETGCPG